MATGMLLYGVIYFSGISFTDLSCPVAVKYLDNFDEEQYFKSWSAIKSLIKSLHIYLNLSRISSLTRTGLHGKASI